MDNSGVNNLAPRGLTSDYLVLTSCAVLNKSPVAIKLQVQYDKNALVKGGNKNGTIIKMWGQRLVTARITKIQTC